MKRLIKDLVVGDKFYYCCGIYEVTEVLSEGQILTKKSIDKACTASRFCLFSRTEEKVELVERIKLKDLFVGAMFKFINNPYATNDARTVLYKDDVAILYVTKKGEYVLVKESNINTLWNEGVEIIPYVEED